MPRNDPERQQHDRHVGAQRSVTLSGDAGETGAGSTGADGVAPETRAEGLDRDGPQSGTGGAGGMHGARSVRHLQSGGTPASRRTAPSARSSARTAGSSIRSATLRGTTKDIGAVTAGGVADAAAQDTFCAGTTCVITVVYDQSGKGNDLGYQGSTQGPGSAASTPGEGDDRESLTVGGNKVYSLYINPGNSYWRDGIEIRHADGQRSPRACTW